MVNLLVHMFYSSFSSPWEVKYSGRTRSVTTSTSSITWSSTPATKITRRRGSDCRRSTAPWWRREPFPAVDRGLALSRATRRIWPSAIDAVAKRSRTATWRCTDSWPTPNSGSCDRATRKFWKTSRIWTWPKVLRRSNWTLSTSQITLTWAWERIPPLLRFQPRTPTSVPQLPATAAFRRARFVRSLRPLKASTVATNTTWKCRSIGPLPLLQFLQFPATARSGRFRRLRPAPVLRPRPSTLRATLARPQSLTSLPRWRRPASTWRCRFHRATGSLERSSRQ